MVPCCNVCEYLLSYPISFFLFFLLNAKFDLEFDFVQRSFGKSDFRSPKREAALHFLFWIGNIVAAAFLALEVEGQHQDILDYVFCAIGALPFVFMIPATVYIVRKYLYFIYFKYFK
jgi:hypothetical protein